MKNCQSCKWANWSDGCLTATGRMKKNGQSGRCDFPVPPLPKLPWSIITTMNVGCASDAPVRNPFEHKSGITFDSGTTCACYEEAEIYPGKKD